MSDPWPFAGTRCVRLCAALAFAIMVVACGGGDSADDRESPAALKKNSIVVPERNAAPRGPVDYGEGAAPVLGSTSTARGSASAGFALQAAEAGAPLNVTGRFGNAFAWPVIPLHAVLVPDGRVMSYGSDERGEQSGQFNYAVWDPALGAGTDSHLLLPNTTGTDLFCSGQIVLPRTGEVLLTGGDRTVNGVRNYGTSDLNFYDYLSNTLRKSTQSMAQPRWYPTVTTLTDGSVLILGGLDDLQVTPAIATPEVYEPGTGWRSLAGATNDDAYGTANWWYPRAWLAPDAQVFVAADSGRTFRVSTSGSGNVTELPLLLPEGSYMLPSVMYAPGKILSIRVGQQAGVIDLNGATPTYTPTASVSQERRWANGTVLADGRVLVTGGSSADNQVQDVAYHSELWDPATGLWTIGASATRMRLYHSTALLLADGRVLTAGGGAPGPVTNLNAEIYEPPYLFKSDGSGDLATRPVIQSAPLQAARGESFNVQVGAGAVAKVAFVKTGSVTHSTDFDQRRLPLSFTQSGNTLTVQAPAAAAIAPPGNYLLFVFDSAGVPSIAKIVRLAAADDAYPNSITVRARAALAGGVGATMEVRVDGTLIGSAQVNNTSVQDHRFALTSVVPAGARLDIVYTNDATIGAENRDLYIESVSINRSDMLPTDAGVAYDRGSGPAAFDGIDVVVGRSELTTNGALRFVAPGAATSTITVRARASIADDVGPVMRIHVDGNLVGVAEVRATAYENHVLRLPVTINPGARVDVAYDNDASVNGDRNLYVESIVVNGATLLPTDPGVVVDLGSGAQAFDGVNVIPGQTDILWNAALRFTAPADTAPKLTVRARATLAGGVGPMMQVLIDGVSAGFKEVNTTTYTNYVYTLPAAVNPSARIDVVFDNDATIGGEDRNLYVESISVNGSTLLPSEPGVVVDIGSGSAAFDGVNVILGQSDILWNAALRFTAPNTAAPTLTVRARATLAGGVGPLMQVLVDGASVGFIEVKAASYTDYVFALTAAVNPSARIDVVFDNDAVIDGADRNLHVESIKVNGTTVVPASPGVVVDIGSGAQAFDGINVIAGQSDLLWNAALRFIAPDAAAPTLTVRARASLAGGVGPLMRVLIDGVSAGFIEVTSAIYTNFVFPLAAAVNPSARIDIVFDNDTVIDGQDRNLYVESITVNGSVVLPSAPGVVVDIGSGAQAFDGINVLPGQTDILWNASLRMVAP